jgi:hypothetical protein
MTVTGSFSAGIIVTILLLSILTPSLEYSLY